MQKWTEFTFTEIGKLSATEVTESRILISRATRIEMFTLVCGRTETRQELQQLNPNMHLRLLSSNARQLRIKTSPCVRVQTPKQLSDSLRSPKQFKAALTHSKSERLDRQVYFLQAPNFISNFICQLCGSLVLTLNSFELTAFLAPHEEYIFVHPEGIPILKIIVTLLREKNRAAGIEPTRSRDRQDQTGSLKTWVISLSGGPNPVDIWIWFKHVA